MAEASAIRSAALLVCTYRRPETFGRMMQSVAALRIPEGLAFSVVIADNNPQSAWEDYVGPAVKGLAWPVHYGHEPEAGYSSARNKALAVALANTKAEVFLFSDDDMILDEGWLEGHLRSLTELGADVVNGRIYGVRERFKHDSLLPKCGAGNVSFRRRLVDPSGMALRFDPAFNKLGMEDQAFFRAAVARGAVIKQSDFPLLYNYYGRDAVPEAEIINKMQTTGVMHHNEVALARREKGLLPALAMASKGIVFGIKALLHKAETVLLRAVGAAEKARKAELSAQKEILKMRGRFGGLSGQIASRQDVRRADPTAGSDNTTAS